jgi:hypothetical protein
MLTRMKLHNDRGKAFRGFALAIALVGSIACGDAEIGEECDDVGSTDCPETHACNGISGTNQKSCQPKT